VSSPIRPIAVDLDGTLLRQDSTNWLMSYMARKHPMLLSSLMVSKLGMGLAAFKWALYSFRSPPADLELNTALVQWLKTQKAQSRPLILISASPEFYVRSQAERLNGLFDDVIGSTQTLNLRAHAKADYLCGQYGFRNFDYIGNSVADVPVWKAAATAYTVNPRWHISLWSLLRFGRTPTVIAKNR